MLSELDDVPNTSITNKYYTPNLSPTDKTVLASMFYAPGVFRLSIFEASTDDRVVVDLFCNHLSL